MKIDAKKYYKSLSLPVKASLWFSISNIFQKGIAFFTVPILTRIMPSADYGEYSVFLSWLQIISIFATLNMWNYVLNNGMIKYENDRNGYVSSLQGLSFVITIAIFLIYIPFSGQWQKMTGLSFSAMAVMFIELLFMPSYEYWCTKERFEYRYKGIVFISVAVTVLIPLISIPLILMVNNDKGMAAIVGRSVTSAMIFIIPTIIIATKGKKFYSKKYWTFALRFNIPLIPHFLSVIILQQSDRIMISHIAGDDKAGIYSVAYSAAAIVQLVNSAILSSYVSYTYTSIKNAQFRKIEKSANYLLILIAGLNLCLICVAPEAIRILGPEEYHEAIYVIPPVAMSGVFIFLFNLFANVEYYFEETKFVTAASIGSAIANVILNALFIPKFGYIAAGYTTLLCYLLYSLGHYYFMRIVCKKHLKGCKLYDTKTICLIIIISVLSAFGIGMMYNFPILRYIIMVLVIGICIIKRDKITQLLEDSS